MFSPIERRSISAIVRNELVHVHGLEFQRLKTRERKHAFRQRRGAMRRRLNSLHDAFDILEFAPRDPLTNKVERRR